jgi:hypothetical protein
LSITREKNVKVFTICTSDCHNFSHKAANCHLNNYKEDPRIKPLARNSSTWKKKDSEKCGLVLSSQKQKHP